MRHQDWQPRVTPRVHCTRPVRCVHERTTRVGIRDPTARRARARHRPDDSPLLARIPRLGATSGRTPTAQTRRTHTYDSARDLDLADPGGALLCKGRPGAPPRRRTAARYHLAALRSAGYPPVADVPQYTNCTGTCGSWHALRCMRHALPATYTIHASWSGLDRRRRTRAGWAASTAGPSQ